MPNGVDRNGESQISYVNSPLISYEVRTFKKELKKLVEDPVGVAQQLDQLLGPNIYMWDELNSIMKALFNPEERDLIRTAAVKDYNNRHARNTIGDEKFPIGRPDWDGNNAVDRQKMQELYEMIIGGIKNAVPKSQNASKMFEVIQKKD